MRASDIVRTSSSVVPVIYAYSTPGIAKHNGWIKIGYTEQDVKTRLEQQMHTADVDYRLEWKGNAVYEGTNEVFLDTAFHAYLRKMDVQTMEEARNEWFKTTKMESQLHFFEFRQNRGILRELGTVIPYSLRPEQKDAVERTLAYARTHERGEFLWNAKPRFGKSLSSYDFCKQLGATNVLIVTNRPAIANSWYSDYEQFLGPESGYLFVSNTDGLQGKKCVLSREQYIDEMLRSDDNFRGCIEFVSLQDLKGSIYFGGKFDKLKEVADTDWDVLIIDEAHEGVDTYKTDVAFDHVKRKFTLHLSGTPFKALANDKFPPEAIYNWTYADEQRSKRDYQGEAENPYAKLPRLNLLTYQMSEIVRDELEQGVEIQGETEEYAFDLNEFFKTDRKTGRFYHESSVDRFLDAMVTQLKFPFSTPELRSELKHTFWLLNRVDSAKALAEKLKVHPVFKDYEIILAAGDGKLDDAEETQKSFDKVTAAIAKGDKNTITLSVGQLTTGVTVPEWTAVLMLSSIKSPSLYMQAAFRAQNPCLFHEGGKHWRKENAYVFDFDPARTLTVFEEFANDLSSDTSAGKGDSETRKQHIRELLNFFPVLGEDENGEMIELDAEKVLTIPRKIRSQEVVRRGFMSNYLFQNISGIFGAPPEVIEIITSFPPVGEPNPVEIKKEDLDSVELDENGDPIVDDTMVIGQSQDVFGDMIYGEPQGEITEELGKKVTEIVRTDPPADEPDKKLEQLKHAFLETAVKPLLEKAKEEYGTELKPAERKKIEKKLTADADRQVGRAYGDYDIQTKRLDQEKQQQILGTMDLVEREQIEADFAKKQQDIAAALQEELTDIVETFTVSAAEEIVRTVETNKVERVKGDIENAVRDHLRGFSRTIPSFLMAYGTDEVTLDTFDLVIPDQVFIEVTSITLDQFRFLRDGGDYTDAETGELKHFTGHLFDSVVFDDSVKEFLRMRERLANYFEDTSTEDIFDYIPPQRTNQIFTPKWVVKRMADMLEEENPGCFDNPDKTFIDLYMKSGLYIAEIVKRLFRSESMKRAFPDDTARLQHIFEKQVYGLAPTEIIYRIAMSYVLGFDTDGVIAHHNLRQVDALAFAKEGTMQENLDRIFAE